MRALAMSSSREKTDVPTASIDTASRPVVCLVALIDARDASGWLVADELPYWIVCLTIAVWGAVALLIVVTQRQSSSE